MRLNKHVRECIFSAHTTDMREVKEGEVIKFKGHMAEFVRACDPDTVVLRGKWGEERPVPADVHGLYYFDNPCDAGAEYAEVSMPCTDPECLIGDN